METHDLTTKIMAIMPKIACKWSSWASRHVVGVLCSSGNTPPHDCPKSYPSLASTGAIVGELNLTLKGDPLDVKAAPPHRLDWHSHSGSLHHGPSGSIAIGRGPRNR